jgi:hypothetical protein
MNTIQRTAAAAAFMALFFGAISLTGPSDIEALADAAMAQDDAVAEARIQAMSQSEAERRAWAVCKGWHAERAQVMRVADTGELVCRRVGVTL